jgi:Holliday junction DNA helicase RuvA
MIAYINGQITHQAPTQVIMDVGGLGYEVQISLHTYERLKDLTTCKLFTYLHITADAHTLYGFADISEKQWFLHLLQVNGIGPRMAMTILSSLTPKDLQQAILGHHTATLQSIKGIGQKVAQRIILELSGKIGKLTDLGEEVTSYMHNQEALRQEALVALSKLGINKVQAEKAILQIIKTHPGELTLETVIKLALKT